MPGVRLDPDALFAGASPARTIGLAVSGGPDSLALMLLAGQWAQVPGRPKFVVYSVDHGLRPEAADEVAMVLREAERLGLPARGLRWAGDKPTRGVQAAARRARYRLIAEAMAADGADVLFTAHHLGDQAETVLMRLAHGSGIEGMRGMDRVSFVEGCEVVRPLLDVHPEALAELVRAAGLIAVHDPSNDDDAYERVRWRKMLPHLQAMGLTLERLGVFARRMGEATALVAERSEEIWPGLVEIGADSARLPHGRLATQNAQVGVALLGQVLELVSGDRRAPPLAPLEAIFGALRGCRPMKPRTLHGCVISSDGTSVRVRREGPRKAAPKSRAAVTAN